jgi:hypothetical protein
VTWIQTHSGRNFAYQNPRADQIQIEDIAISLARQPRYLGHTVGKRAYSVAQHSVHCCDWVTYVCKDGPAITREEKKRLMLGALLHDAHEAYTGDLPSPLKQLLPEYQAICHRIQREIAVALDASAAFESARVKRVDLRVFATEVRDQMAPPPEPWESLQHVDPLPFTIKPWRERRARREFMERFDGLRAQWAVP